MYVPVKFAGSLNPFVALYVCPVKFALKFQFVSTYSLPANASELCFVHFNVSPCNSNVHVPFVPSGAPAGICSALWHITISFISATGIHTNSFWSSSLTTNPPDIVSSPSVVDTVSPVGITALIVFVSPFSATVSSITAVIFPLSAAVFKFPVKLAYCTKLTPVPSPSSVVTYPCGTTGSSGISSGSSSPGFPPPVSSPINFTSVSVIWYLYFAYFPCTVNTIIVVSSVIYSYFSGSIISTFFPSVVNVSFA